MECSYLCFMILLQVEPTVRCAVCCRPLFMAPPLAANRDSKIETSRTASNDSNDGNYVSNTDGDSHSSNGDSSGIPPHQIRNNLNLNSKNNNSRNQLFQRSKENSDKEIYQTINMNEKNSGGKIWGNNDLGSDSTGLIIYSRKLAYHSFCYDKIQKQV